MLKNNTRLIMHDDEIDDDLTKLICSTKVWDHMAYKAALMRNVKSWINFYGGEEQFKAELEFSRKEDGMVYQTKECVEIINDKFKAEVFFYEEKGKHKDLHFKVSDRQGKVNAIFKLSDCTLIKGSVKKSKCLRQIEYWFNSGGQSKIKEILNKQG